MSLTGAGITIVVMAALFAFLNGAQDGANPLATIITSRSIDRYAEAADVVNYVVVKVT